MTWYERMNRAIGYIEDNLCEGVDFQQVSRITGQTPVSFQRTFSIVTDLSVFEYIRRRKLTLAAFDLQQSGAKVLDVALKYGYESPEAFARAFRELHGFAPSAARAPGAPFKAFPRISFLLSVKGDTAMEYRIESKQPFSVYGIEGIFTAEDGKNLRDIPRFWMECSEDGRIDRLIRSTGEPLSRVHAICDYRATEGNTFPYMIFVTHTEACDARGFTEVEVPAATWAIFKTREHTPEETSGVVQALIKRVYTDWLPTAAYRKVDGYELELYLATGLGSYVCETWIRVEPK